MVREKTWEKCPDYLLNEQKNRITIHISKTIYTEMHTLIYVHFGYLLNSTMPFNQITIAANLVIPFNDGANIRSLNIREATIA